MHTFILVTHILSMSLSLLLMTGAIGMALVGMKSSVKTASIGIVATVSGFVTGGMLLLGSPLTMQCVTLTAYLLVMVGVYRFGFGMGHIENARLVQSR